MMAGTDLKTDVLDHGYVARVGVFGNDLMVVNAARVSHDVRHTKFTAADKKLLRFLAVNGHSSPFYHPKLQFEIYAPIFVTRQWQRHIVDSAHTSEGVALNELSRRYTEDNVEFYEPKVWRGTHKTNKQGSGVPVADQASWRDMMHACVEDGIYAYREALKAGIAGEQARFFLPANVEYTRWQWTCSLQAAMHFVALREKEDAQWEIQQYARAVAPMVEEAFPETWAAFHEEAVVK